MELDVAAAQGCAGRMVQVVGPAHPVAAHPDLKGIIATRLTVISHIHLIGEPRLTVELGCALDMTRRRRRVSVGCNASPLHLRTILAMVDVGQMAPKTAVLDPTCDTEVPFLTRWRCDPSSTGHEVPTRANGSATGDISMRRGDNDVRNPSTTTCSALTIFP